MTASTIVKWYCQHHLVGPQPNVTRIPTMCVECDVGMLGYKLTEMSETVNSVPSSANHMACIGGYYKDKNVVGSGSHD